ncbi:MAG: 6-phosphogluconolactonase [Deferribacteres bacterium]|nr:6-phosphogluconolactonase [Deferribacteres bacterium]
MVREILIFRDAGLMADHTAGEWAAIAGKAVRDKGRFTAALSGGKTPVDLYRRLSRIKDLPWDRTHIFIVDERFVPFEHEASNYGMIERTLLRHTGIPRENVHPVPTAVDTPGEAAGRYEEELEYFFGLRHPRGEGMPRFDLILLGLGADGHTASLFPGDPALKETSRLAAAVSPSGFAEHERITLTLPVINNAANIMVLAAGDSKAAAVREVIAESNSPLPAAMVRPEQGRLVFLLDRRAASLLSC